MDRGFIFCPVLSFCLIVRLGLSDSPVFLMQGDWLIFHSRLIWNQSPLKGTDFQLKRVSFFVNSPFSLSKFNQFFPFYPIFMPAPRIPATVNRGVLFWPSRFLWKHSTAWSRSKRSAVFSGAWCSALTINELNYGLQKDRPPQLVIVNWWENLILNFYFFFII